MKKIALSLLVIFSVVFMAGCDSSSKEEKVMKDYSKKYYDEYVKNSFTVSEINITVGQIRDVTSRLNASFDVSKISSCTDDSYVTLKIDESNSEIKEYIFNLNCSK